MAELQQKQLRQLAQALHATNITVHSEGVSEPLRCVAIAFGAAGCMAKLWQGRNTERFYYAVNYSASLYKF